MKKFTFLLASLLVAFGAMAQTYYPGSRTTTLEAGKQYFISVATHYGSACTNLLYNNSGTLTKSDLLPSASTDNAAYLFTVEEIGDGYLAYIKNSDGNYIQADVLTSTETKTGVYVIPYFVGKAVCCGNDVDACDENGNWIDYETITAETPIVTVQKNADYTNADNRNGWRYIGGLSAGANWCTAFAFYEVAELTDEALTEKQNALKETITSAQTLLTTAEFSSTGGEITLQVTDPSAAGYISCSNIDPEEGNNMAWLIDGNNNTFIHTNWHSASSSNDYLTVYLGEGNGIEEFYFNEVTRSSAQADFPKSVQILGSTDGNEYTEITVIDGLPQSGGTSYKSDLIECDPSYTYLRFIVTTGNNRIYFHMAEFGMSTPVTTTVNAEYENKAKILYGLSLAVAEAETVTESTDIAVIDEAKSNIEMYMAELNKEYPFTITTDDENPVLYAIKSGRGDAYWYTYDSSDSKISLSEYTGADTQLWFFKETTTDDYKCALQLYPYADKTKAMSYENTNSGVGTIVAQTPGTEGWTNTWLLVSTNDAAPYGLQTYNKANYLSNNGGTTNKMGMWTDAPNDDAGTAMYFSTPSETLQALIDKAKVLATCTGTAVGYYTEVTVTALNAAITIAEDNLKNGNYSVTDLNAAIAALETIQPTEGAFYHIASAVPASDSRSGKKIYVNNTGGMMFQDATTMGEVFQFVPAGDNMFYLYNVERGTYLSTAKAHNGGQEAALATTTENAVRVAISNLGSANIVQIVPEGGAMMHAQEAGSTVVAWKNESYEGASAWIISEVTDITALSHNVTVSDAGYATLYLNYAVTIPEGVNVYGVTEATNGWAIMDKISGTIPANTGVILENAGEFIFNYSNEAGEGTSILKGTLLDENKGDDAYVLAIANEQVGLYLATKNQDENTTFKNNAFKAYLVPEVQENIASYSFNFDWNGTTGIENIEGAVEEENATETIYDITGRQIKAITVPGIYIINGKKTFVK
ncbi:MAG: discoidin domain-containing protein [Bacteroidaceae bacterium]|nr:discoidin domain-containing protein [Bacteroidaceae bacterium]